MWGLIGTVATPQNKMNRLVLTASFLAILGMDAHAASVTNNDADPHTLVVTEDGSKTELTVGGGQTLSFCSNGCFVTMPDGDRTALSGSEKIQISGGRATIQ